MENAAILREWFDRVDSDKTGSITAAQLRSAFAVGNLEFPISIVQQMIRMYDFDRNGTMSFEEFVALNKFLLKEAAPKPPGIFICQVYPCMYYMQPLITNGKPENHVYGSTCLLRLGEVNYWGRGYLVPDEVYEALIKIGFSLDSPAFYTVCESFDQKKNGIFRLDDLISLCIFVQSARNLFNSFDTSKQGRVTLDLNQFVYCTANCRI